MKIKIPGSKSITQRALICSSLAKGKSVLINPLFCEDSELLVAALKKLGIRIRRNNDNLIVYGNYGKFKDNGKLKIYMGNNGTGLRFLLSLACFYPNEVEIFGNERMKNRPVKELVDVLIKSGFDIDYIENEGYPPVVIKNFNIFKNIDYINIKATKSSQFVSSVLLSSVLFKRDLKIIINENVPSKPYIEMTLQVMKEFGVDVKKSKNYFLISKNSNYFSKNFYIEGDFSSATYFLILPFFINYEIEIENLNYYKSLQPDKFFVDILKKMGANIKIGPNSIKVYPSKLNRVEVDMNKMPDAVPALAVLASIVDGETIIKNIAHLRIKESDRIYAIEKNLNKIGIKVKAGDDFLIIQGKSNIKKINNDKIVIETFNDHRIAMSFSLFKGLNIGIELDNKNCVKKSFPDFFEKLQKIIDNLN